MEEIIRNILTHYQMTKILSEMTATNIKFVFHRIENIMGKVENAGCQHFLLFPQCFQKGFFLWASKVTVGTVLKKKSSSEQS